MKRFLKWTIGIGLTTAATVFTIQAIQAGRQKVKHALGEAEQIANQTRETLAQTQTALRDMRQAI
jgi:hypothetical protein